MTGVCLGCLVVDSFSNALVLFFVDEDDEEEAAVGSKRKADEDLEPEVSKR